MKNHAFSHEVTGHLEYCANGRAVCSIDTSTEHLLGLMLRLTGNTRMTGLAHTLMILASVVTAEPQIQQAAPWQTGVILAEDSTPLKVPQATPADPASEAAPDATPPAEPQGEDLTQPDPGQPAQTDDEGTSPDELSLGEIPVIETMELTPGIARRSLDSYLATKERYSDTDLEQYENLQDFVDQTPEGKNFEADIKAAGFANVADWNLAITTLGVIYGSVIDDQTPDLLQQIQEVEQDTELAQDIKDRMIKALKAMIPSDNNKKIVEDMMADPVYGPKLNQLDIEEE